MVNTLIYSLGAVALATLLWRLTRRNTLDQVPGPPNGSWITGNLVQIYHPNAESYIRYLQETFGNAVRTRGVFSRTVLFLSDPMALHHVLVKEFQIFEKTNAANEMVKWTFGDSLLSVAGEKHRRQRKMLNPLFSTKNMREIMPILVPVASEMTAALEKRINSGEREVEVLSIMSRAALEYLGRGALGHSFGRYEDDQPTAHSNAIQNLSSHLMPIFYLALATPTLVLRVMPAWVRQKLLELLPFRSVQVPLRLIKTLDIEAHRMVDERRIALFEGSGQEQSDTGRKDILSVLLKANSAADAEDRLLDSEIYGQINMFLFAGQDTTSHAIARVLDQLAHFPEVQSKLRAELREAKEACGSEDFDYDTLMSLPYLDAVCRETLRLFPPISVIEREAQKDIIVPLIWPIKAIDGKTIIGEIFLRKGTMVMISMLSANRCKKVWGDDAEIWKPERWLAVLPKSVEEARIPGVYSSLMTFIGGPRACIGFKYSEMEMKLVLASLIGKFAFSRGPEIQWDISGIAKPDVVGQPSPAGSLPLKVAIAD